MAPRIALSCWSDTRGPHNIYSWTTAQTTVPWTSREQSVQRFSLIEECHSQGGPNDEIKFKMQMLRNVGVLCMCTTFRAAPFLLHGSSSLLGGAEGTTSHHQKQISLLIPKKRKKSLMLYSLSLMWRMTSTECAPESDDDLSNTNGGICDSGEINRILALCDVLKAQLQQVSGVLRDLLSDNPNHLNNDTHPIHSHMREFLRKVHVLSHTPGISHKSISLDQTIFAKSPAYPMDFIAKVITCHLQMHGKTVVVGHDCDEINRWINTLTLFVLPQDTKLCRYAQPASLQSTTHPGPAGAQLDASPHSSTSSATTTSSSPGSALFSPSHIIPEHTSIPEYIPELWVQGLPIHESFKINNSALSLIFSPHKVMQSPFPFCIVDIVNRQVKTLFKYDQLVAWKSHFRETQADEYRLIMSSTNQRKAMLKKHKSRAFNLPLQLPITPTFSRKRSASDGGSGSSLPLPESSDFKFHTCTDICTSVTNLFDQSKALPSYMRKGWICEYMRNIQRKSILLTKMLEQYLIENPNPSPTEKRQVQDLVFDWIHDMDKCFSSEDRKKSLSERDEIQMEILIAAAQKMTSHEIYSFMKG
eukprot:CAMPEP_0117450642 /NCGR_PEP_ID=MMETSP0759-20121206/8579_1 /TAXON_ID=63605 /ORGANISM="Percolomonas cosmopolitus, Strain WS" /LENGTH=586 /DNA_ID=CAMNT_0005243181 /DNA_START=14 /DNA_END=1771 /DNA_ORIENTATION=+